MNTFLPPPFEFHASEKYFDMKKNQCKEGLDIYKKFLARMTKLSEFLKVAEVNTPSNWIVLHSALCTGTVISAHSNKSLFPISWKQSTNVVVVVVFIFM